MKTGFIAVIFIQCMTVCGTSFGQTDGVEESDERRIDDVADTVGGSIGELSSNTESEAEIDEVEENTTERNAAANGEDENSEPLENLISSNDSNMAAPMPLGGGGIDYSDYPPMVVELDDTGACVTDLAEAKLTNEKESLRYSNECAKLFLPMKPAIATPGSLFIGAALGNKDKKFIIAPAVNISLGAAIPIYRPNLTPSIVDGNVVFRLPRTTRFYMDFIVSANAAIEGVLYPGTEDDKGDTASTFSWSTGVYTGLELGGVTFTKQGTVERKVAFLLGVLMGYMGQSDIVGDAFIVGAQPAIVMQF